jgi:hypothetical protein
LPDPACAIHRLGFLFHSARSRLTASFVAFPHPKTRSRAARSRASASRPASSKSGGTDQRPARGPAVIGIPGTCLAKKINSISGGRSITVAKGRWTSRRGSLVLTSTSGDVPHRRTMPAVIGAGRLDPVFKYAIALDRSTDGGEFVIERGLGLVHLSVPRCPGGGRLLAGGPRRCAGLRTGLCCAHIAGYVNVRRECTTTLGDHMAEFPPYSRVVCLKPQGS